MALEFCGEVAELYQEYRHGYPPVVVQRIVDAFGLGTDDVALDLGCGTGQLTLALAPRLGAVLGVDPEPDMLTQARRAAEASGACNVGWMLGSDQSLTMVRKLLGVGRFGTITVAQALHWMDRRALFDNGRALLREGGGIAVVSNGIPLWLHDTDWGKATRSFLERWFDTSLSAWCGTDSATQQHYADDLLEAGYSVTRTVEQTAARLDFEHLAGGILSALPASRLPRAQERDRFLQQLRSALGAAEHFDETVPVVTIIGRC